MNDRKRWYLLAPVALALVMCASASCCLAVRRARSNTGDDQMTLTHDGLERTFYLHVPPSYDETQPIPLVTALHGGGGTAEGMRKLASGLDDLADREGFIVVYPDGVDKHWNDGREIAGNNNTTTDDVGFLSALIDHLAEEYAIDPSRVYATGISNGGHMSFRLACELPAKIAAVAPVAAALSEDLHAVCSPSQPVSVAVINGTDDPLVPWEGGEIEFGRQKRGKVTSTSDTIAFWADHNNCTATPIVTQEPDSDPDDGTRVRREAYAQCDDGTAAVLYAIVGGGHTWPGGWQYLPEPVIGKTSRDIDANEVIWHFFKEHARQ